MNEHTHIYVQAPLLNEHTHVCIQPRLLMNKRALAEPESKLG